MHARIFAIYAPIYVPGQNRSCFAMTSFRRLSARGWNQSKDVLDTEQGPYIVVAVQECSRMNVLLGELKRSLVELVKGMDGQLNKTQAMEDLQQALAKNEVII